VLLVIVVEPSKGQRGGGTVILHGGGPVACGAGAHFRGGAALWCNDGNLSGGGALRRIRSAHHRLVLLFYKAQCMVMEVVVVGLVVWGKGVFFKGCVFFCC
jgi:hypothetical protein